MDTTLFNAQQWAQTEFTRVELGDRRRHKRLIGVAAALVAHPAGTLPGAFPEWAELKGAYRLFSNPHVSYEKILTPHCQRIQQQCTQAGEYLLIEDSSDLDYSSHRSCTGLGRIGNDYGRGLCLHTMLVARVQAWDLQQSPELEILGVGAQQCWARTTPSYRQQKERWRQRMARPRESQRWAKGLSDWPKRPAEVSWIYLADREADVYETFGRCQQAHCDFIIRAQHNRNLDGPPESLFEAVGSAPVVGDFTIPIRGRPERTARLAHLQIRVARVVLQGVWRPNGPQEALAVNVVEAREVDGPAHEEPIHWTLLTSLAADRFVEARRIVARYAKRWIIEEFHKALKTGAQVEKSQLETVDRIRALVAVLVIVAVRLINLKLVARSKPEQVIHVESFGPEAVEILTARFGPPKTGWTHGALLVAIARLGGFLARRGDGNPGWITIWRGWDRLMAMVDGVRSLQPKFTGIEARRCG